MPLPLALAAMPWTKILKVGLVVSAAALVASTVFAHFRYVRQLDERAVAAEVSSKIAISSLKKARLAIGKQNASIEKANQDRDAAQAAFDQAMSRPPRVVVREADPVAVDAAVPSLECETMIGEAWRYVQTVIEPGFESADTDGLS